MTFDSLLSNEKFQEKLYEAKDITEVKELLAVAVLWVDAKRISEGAA